MKKLLKLLICLVPIFCNAQKIYLGIAAPFHLTDLNGKTAVFVGDSYTVGIAASPLSNRFSTLVCDYFGMVENNLGVSGRSMQGNGCSGGVLDKTIIPNYVEGVTGVLIIALGTNDAGENNGVSDTSRFRMKYDSVLDYAINVQGYPLKRIVLFSPYYIRDYNVWVGFGTCGVSVAATEARFLQYCDKVNKIGLKWGIRVFDLYNFVKPIYTSILSGDDIHPTNSGHSQLAIKIESLL